jgi:hypothetical protein
MTVFPTLTQRPEVRTLIDTHGGPIGKGNVLWDAGMKGRAVLGITPKKYVKRLKGDKYQVVSC